MATVLRGEEGFVLEAIWRSQAILTMSIDGYVLDANDIFLKRMGYSLEEIRGQHHRLFVTPEYAASTDYQKFWDRLSSGDFQVAELLRISKSGQGVWFQATYTPILDDKGKAFKIIKFATDITEQKKRIADYTGEVEAIRRSQLVVTFSMDGTIIDANCNFLKIMGYTLEEVRDFSSHSIVIYPKYLIASSAGPR